jgi:predicted HD superfamily hydrolase involved in NAD metabolism
VIFTTDDLETLREEVRKRLSPSRFAHTLMVEAEVIAMGQIYMPNDILELRVAALLHDVTKVGTNESQFALAKELGLQCSDEELLAPQVLHGRTAATLIPRDFPDYSTPRVLSAVLKHTVGDVGMSTFDMIIFVADYIEASREIESCQKARDFFWNAPVTTLATEKHLKRTTHLILENTIAYLKEKQAIIDSHTLRTYEWLCCELGL